MYEVLLALAKAIERREMAILAEIVAVRHGALNQEHPAIFPRNPSKEENQNV